MTPTPIFPLGNVWDVSAGDLQGESAAIQTLAGDGHLALVSFHDGGLHAFNCVDGALLWSRKQIPGSISIGAGLLVTARRNGAVRNIDLRTGDEIWRTQTSVSDPLVPCIDNDRIVVAGRGLASLEAKTGVIHWTRDEAQFTSPPRVIDARIIVGDSRGIVHALDARTGRTRWTRRTNGALVCPAVGDRDGRLLLGTTGGWFMALRISNGGLIWRWRVGADAIHSAVIHEDRVCFAGNDAVMYALKRRNGHMIWRSPLPSRPIGPPLLYETTLLVACYSEHEGRSVIVGIDVTSGRRLGTFETPAELAVPPLSCGERLALGLRDRSILILAHQSPTPTPAPTPIPPPSPTPTPSSVDLSALAPATASPSPLESPLSVDIEP